MRKIEFSNWKLALAFLAATLPVVAAAEHVDARTVLSAIGAGCIAVNALITDPRHQEEREDQP